MHCMQKATSDLPSLVRQVLAVAEHQGLTQVELQRQTGISQGHLSKVLRGAREPGPKVRRQFHRFLEEQKASGAAPTSEALGKAVAAAAEESPEFAKLVTSALRIMHKYA